MPHDSFVRLLATGFFSVLALATLPANGAAQDFERAPIDPDMQVKEGFDTDRAIFWAKPNFIPLRDPEWQSLSQALRSGDISDETTVVAFEMAGKTLALVSSQMSYHHVAQGEMAGEPWMVTF
ncbi:MAG: DUF3179 domain-containing protein [Gemmatimonadales bacterium]|jgi:hypothetical protein|nr:DUF3179 domain-containing protein [Gemmatimonadales bacterium]MBT3499379.1 DUF3179 domain-containing protein [Gemmatimonadales bacterium]MBT3774183.1 DUF3179 domain-containing protein [Gemmatimonadales bacterium]MBT3958293.1 DUF3179 domain-containing protein [Gemmatimonadales bacterium]MBT4188500.1 DUF3179 domain-containing protein [Gemmatimonadales bacterium]